MEELFKQICRVKENYDNDFVQLLKFIYDKVRLYHFNERSESGDEDEIYNLWFEDEIKNNIYDRPDDFKLKIIRQFGQRKAERMYENILDTPVNRLGDIYVHHLYYHILIDFSFRKSIWSYEESKELFEDKRSESSEGISFHLRL
jgi:hypothetical protein